MKKLVIIISFLISWLPVVAQQDILFTQYEYNKLALNPAYAGSQEIFAADLLTRIQWVGIEGAPRTVSLTAHTPLRNEHIGLGISLYRDALGPTVEFGGMGTFAFRILFPTTRLCFGLSGGFRYSNIDWSKLNAKTGSDFELINQVNSKVVPDADFGIYYYGKRFYVGVSSKHLFQNQMIVAENVPGDPEQYSYTKLLRHFFGIAGGALPIGDNIVFMPSLMCKYVKNAPFQTDFNASFMFYDVLTLGISYRTEAAIGFIANINISKNLTFGYSYDLWFNALKNYNKGSHEVHLGFGFDLFNRDRMVTPRYF